MATVESPCGHIVIGNDRIPIYNLKYSGASMQEVDRRAKMSTTEQQLRDFCAEHNLAYDTVLQVVAHDALDSISPAESLAALAAEINRGLVLHATNVKPGTRAKRREGKAGERRAMAGGASRKRTAAERNAAQAKLKNWRRGQ